MSRFNPLAQMKFNIFQIFLIIVFDIVQDFKFEIYALELNHKFLFGRRQVYPHQSY